MKRVYITILLSFVLSDYLSAQNSAIQFGTQVPLMYSVGYELQLNNVSAINLQGGILTKPYDKLILDVLKLFGTSEPIVNTIGEAYHIGYTLQPTFKYNFKNFYTGAFFSYYSLFANETPAGAIESYFGISFLPEIKSSDMRLNSELYNVGILFGKKVTLKNDNLSLNMELSVGKTFFSESRLTSTNTGKENSASSLVNSKLKDYFQDYGYLPSLNIFLVKSF